VRARYIILIGTKAVGNQLESVCVGAEGFRKRSEELLQACFVSLVWTPDVRDCEREYSAVLFPSIQQAARCQYYIRLCSLARVAGCELEDVMLTTEETKV
jgi:hypothetical protein